MEVKPESSSSFGKEYFEGNEEKLGIYYSYDTSLLPIFQRLATELKDQSSASSTLDIGCAKGYLVSSFRRIGVKSFGVDVSQYALSHAPPDAQSFLTNVDLSRERLPFEDGKFDLVTAFGVLYYLEDLSLVTSEIRRVLKKGGMFVMTIVYNNSELVVNVHGDEFWIDNFVQGGFNFLPKETSNLSSKMANFYIDLYLNQGRSLRWKVAKFLDKIPRFGRRFLRWRWFQKKGIGTLVFDVT